MRGRLLKIAVIAVVVLAAGWWVADNHLVFGPTIRVRNETASPAFLTVAGYYGDDEDLMTVPPWKPGVCATASWTWHHHGSPAAAGNGTAAFWLAPGSSTTVTLTPLEDGKPPYVRIDATGAVHTGEPVPDEAPGCAQYTVRNGWRWSEGDGGEPPVEPWSIRDAGGWRSGLDR